MVPGRGQGAECRAEQRQRRRILGGIDDHRSHPGMATRFPARVGRPGLGLGIQARSAGRCAARTVIHATPCFDAAVLHSDNSPVPQGSLEQASACAASRRNTFPIAGNLS